MTSNWPSSTNASLPNLEVRMAQVALLFLGYAPGKIDGIIGPCTRAAIKNFHMADEAPAVEDLDGPTYRLLCKKKRIRPKRYMPATSTVPIAPNTQTDATHQRRSGSKSSLGC